NGRGRWGGRGEELGGGGIFKKKKKKRKEGENGGSEDKRGEDERAEDMGKKQIIRGERGGSERWREETEWQVEQRAEEDRQHVHGADGSRLVRRGHVADSEYAE